MVSFLLVYLYPSYKEMDIERKIENENASDEIKVKNIINL